MAGMSQFVEDSLLDWVGGTPMPAPPAQLWFAVYTVATNDVGAGGTEQTTNGFSRQQLTLTAKFTDDDGTRNRAISATVTLGPNSGGSPVGPLVGWAIWSVSSGGTASQLVLSDLFRDAGGTPITKTIAPGDRLELAANADPKLAQLKIRFT